MEKIRLLHTNDLHSHLENWPKIRRFLDQRKREASQNNETILTVDLGDFVDRWHPLTEATSGQANVELMNQIGYDAVTIGNNEGVGSSKDELDHLYDQANFDVLLGNLFDKRTLEMPKWAQPSKIITSIEGTKIGLFALTAPFPLTYSPNGWDIRFPQDLLPELVESLRGQVDVLVLMSHLGITEDRKIAATFPEIDLILGSHTHHLFMEGEIVNGVQLAAAGKFGQYVGDIVLTVDQQHRLKEATVRAVPTATMTEFPEDQAEIEGYLARGHALLQEKKVAAIPHDLKVGTGDYLLIEATLRAMKERADVEVAIVNSGLFLAPIMKGLVDQDQLHQSLPHPMHLIRVSLLGSDLIRLVLEMEKNRSFLRNYPIIGMGFRGKIFGEICYSGLEFDAVNHKVRWLGEPIIPESSYTFVTVDHFMFIPFFPTIEIAGSCEFLFPEFIRSVLGDSLKSHYLID
ncbi:multifunctional 2',3'-cyclic-nucleotide 2'-phosphodiesterase/5'-nucleotidase/3'-nucleotidase [Enterococcus sp. JM4C]|uniref:bifunctional metallophosphatase/5'-nucleotidase n=1 Tax=Candidatus Enterococcus huntleyi TaxID=1857217 RepID=UPI001379E6DD|nr:bifunctional metallophosphatase/5'-nucleotidase [Enterococcus sp. JM4C]KAF1298315.1 multifunctional 2',3'-cyclic-nucleotide 2'-phosphodiesterase/5'-nucleotidase/3'-nucleotidase [Enterococcus sp. JM4C]